MPLPIARSARIVCTLVLPPLLGSCGSGGWTSAPAPARGAGDAAIEAPSLQTGLRLYRQGDLKGAEAALAGARRGAPRDRRILETLGSIYARTDRWRQA